MCERLQKDNMMFLQICRARQASMCIFGTRDCQFPSRDVSEYLRKQEKTLRHLYCGRASNRKTGREVCDVELVQLLSVGAPRIRHVLRTRRHLSSVSQLRPPLFRMGALRQATEPDHSPRGQLDVIARLDRGRRRSIDPQPRTDACASARYLTASAWADHNTRRARPPHHQRRSEAAPRQRRAARPHRRAAEVSLRAQHRAAARRHPVRRTAHRRFRAIGTSSSTTRIRTSWPARTSRPS